MRRLAPTGKSPIKRNSVRKGTIAYLNTEGPRPGPAGAPRRIPGAEFSYSEPVGSIVSATGNLIFGPVGFFRVIARRGDFVNPLIFALICAAINGALTAVLGVIAALAGSEGSWAALPGLIGGIVLVPVFTAVGLFVFAAVLHVLVLLFVRPSNAGFEATFRWALTPRSPSS